jgi:hypothetical protein
MKIIVFIIGAILVLLGGLWLVQGLGLVQIEPIACVAECTPLEGPSLTWAVIGAATLAVGVAVILYGRKHRS